MLSDHSMESQVPVPVYFNESYAELSNQLSYKGSRIARLIYASATNVQIIPMDAPFLSVSYSVNFYGPSFKCTLEKFDRQPTTQLRVVEVDNFSNATSNVLSFYTTLNDKYIQCALYNTSFHTQFSFENGIQSTSNVLKFVNPVKYPDSTTDTRDIPSSLPYQDWMDPISGMLKGYLILDSSSDAVGWFSGIGLTGLVYSSDIRPMLAAQLPNDPSIGSEQLFKPLEDLLEEFSVNMTIGLFSSSVLSYVYHVCYIGRWSSLTCRGVDHPYTIRRSQSHLPLTSMHTVEKTSSCRILQVLPAASSLYSLGCGPFD